MTAAPETARLAQRLLQVLHERGGCMSPLELVTYQDETLPQFFAAFEHMKSNKWIEHTGGKV
jgi:hypothetical protein